ncbi:MmcQ/YjbR family DNA-binding protein [Terrarubrum flagellatum]|uniref:MmcQ/YjbR family DNA-binding protein n=1 Tax=Terrirubrum flagellatum TaxID=2895980 RepID=UPI0031452DF4
MNIRSFDAACGKLPGAVLSVQWGDEHVWKIGGKMFAWASPGRKPFACSMKASDIAWEALAGKAGVRPAPYLARAGWLQIDHGAMPDREIADMLRVAHALVISRLPKKVQAALAV